MTADPLKLQPDNIDDQNVRFAFDQVKLWADSITDTINALAGDQWSLEQLNATSFDVSLGKLTIRLFTGVILGTTASGNHVTEFSFDGIVVGCCGTYVHKTTADVYTTGIATIRNSFSEQGGGGTIDSVRFDEGSATANTRVVRIFNERSDREAECNLFVAYIKD